MAPFVPNEQSIFVGPYTLQDWELVSFIEPSRPANVLSVNGDLHFSKLAFHISGEDIAVGMTGVEYLSSLHLFTDLIDYFLGYLRTEVTDDNFRVPKAKIQTRQVRKMRGQ
jgi:hypothetical protein